MNATINTNNLRHVSSAIFINTAAVIQMVVEISSNISMHISCIKSKTPVYLLSKYNLLYS